MHIVAIIELAGPLEAEATALAADLGTTVYEERLKLVAGLPAIVLKSADPAPARALLAKVRARGHAAVTCDSVSVTPASAMIPIRRFAFEPDALVLPDLPGTRLPWDDILGLFRATHVTQTETRTDVVVEQLRGAFRRPKIVKTEEKTQATRRDQVLYLFRAGGETPWLLRERGAEYKELGAELAPSSPQNFPTMIATLRALAPRAVYDERLMTVRNVPPHLRHTGSRSTQILSVSSASGVDLLAHALALWLSTRPTNPFR